MRRTLVLAVPVMLLAACGGEPKSDAAPDSMAAVSSMVTPAEVTIVAKDFAFEAPDTISGGVVSLKLVNQGTTYHHVQLLRLLDGKTVADLAEGLKQMQPGSPPPPWMQDVAGPNSPDPGGESHLVRELTPGNYAMICFIDTPDHVPHMMKGMMKGLTVTAPAAQVADAPASDVTVQMSDYNWSLSAPLTAGKHVIRIENLAQQSHELFLVRLDEGKTKDDFMKWGATYEGNVPGRSMGGVSAQASGDVTYLPVDLSAGNYLMVCFVPDAKDGKAHLMHGMIQEFSIS